MLEDEKLKRSSLEDGEWDQLPPEQRREVRCVCVCVCVCFACVCVCPRLHYRLLTLCPAAY
jgi:hypothetical protein